MKVLELTQGYVAVVSSEDWKRIRKVSWRVTKSGGKGRKPGAPYAKGCIKGKQVYLHRFVMNCYESSLHVDHKNHQTLDCRRENLEIVTHAENQRRRRKRK